MVQGKVAATTRMILYTSQGLSGLYAVSIEPEVELSLCKICLHRCSALASRDTVTSTTGIENTMIRRNSDCVGSTDNDMTTGSVLKRRLGVERVCNKDDDYDDCAPIQQRRLFVYRPDSALKQSECS